MIETSLHPFAPAGASKPIQPVAQPFDEEATMAAIRQILVESNTLLPRDTRPSDRSLRGDPPAKVGAAEAHGLPTLRDPEGTPANRRLRGFLRGLLSRR